MFIKLSEFKTLMVYPTDNATNLPWGPLARTGATNPFEGFYNTEQTLKVPYVNPVGLQMQYETEGQTACKVCAELVALGYDDWYLPASEELRAMIADSTLSLRKYYWSSTETTPGRALNSTDVTPRTGVKVIVKIQNEKYYGLAVRCVRDSMPSRD